MSQGVWLNVADGDNNYVALKWDNIVGMSCRYTTEWELIVKTSENNGSLNPGYLFTTSTSQTFIKHTIWALYADAENRTTGQVGSSGTLPDRANYE